MDEIHSTTILAVRYNKKLVLAGDGQVTVGSTIMKHGAKKIRRLKDFEVLAGFAGSAADSFTLFELFEAKMKEFNGNLSKASIALAKEWRTDKYLRRLEAMLIVADKKDMFLLSGMGDVITPDDNVLAIGSGGNYALASARGIISTKPKIKAKEIAEKSMNIASKICVFTNDHFVFEEIDSE